MLKTDNLKSSLKKATCYVQGNPCSAYFAEKHFRPEVVDNAFKLMKEKNLPIKNTLPGTSLVAQWLRIRPPMQGTWDQSLAWEDPTCCGATKPVHHNY